jgi:SAM-dependent methyltransferase
MQTDVSQYWEERLGRGASLENVGFRALGRNFNAWMYRVRRARFLERVHEAMRSAGIDAAQARVLDAGCGSGFYVECWKKLGVRSITGFDITKASVTALGARYPDVRFRQVDIGAPVLPDAPASYDAVSCMDVLFHIVDDDRYASALRNIATMLRPGGLFIFTENCVHGPVIRSAFQTSRPLSEIEALLHGCGFELLSRAPVFVLMNSPIDSNSRSLQTYWKTLQRAVMRAEAIGWAAGAALYCIERPLTRLLSEGPSTEMLIAKRSTSE